VIGKIAGQKYLAATRAYFVGFSHVRKRQRLTLWKEVPLMSNLIMSLPATRWGAALPGARMPKAMSGPLGQIDVLWPSYGSPLPGTSGVATSSVATSSVATSSVATSSVVMGAAAGTGTARVGGAGTEAGAGLGSTRRLSAINERPTDNRKQQYVHKTRVNAGGDGASGPEPEREQALQQVRPGRSPSGRGPAKPGSAALLFRRPRSH